MLMSRQDLPPLRPYLSRLSLLALPLFLACASQDPTSALPAPNPDLGRLVETASIGAESGPDEALFGRISSVWEHQREIYVVDSQVPAVAVFSLDGVHLRTIGREGDGPGEYRRPAAVSVAPNGDIYVLELRGGEGLLIVYSRGGQYLETASFPSSVVGGPFFVDHNKNAYTKVAIRKEDDDEAADLFWGVVIVEHITGAREPIFFYESTSPNSLNWMMRLPTGRTIGRVPYSPREQLALGPGGMTAFGHSDVYRVTIRLPTQEAIVVTRDVPAVTLLPSEAQYHRARATASVRRFFPGWKWNGPDLPKTKPAYVAIRIGLRRNVWVIRQGQGEQLPSCSVRDPATDEELPCWADSHVADVFNHTGQLLRTLRLPRDVGLLDVAYIRDDIVVARSEDDLGVQRIKRYEVLSPPR